MVGASVHVFFLHCCLRMPARAAPGTQLERQGPEATRKEKKTRRARAGGACESMPARACAAPACLPSHHPAISPSHRPICAACGRGACMPACMLCHATNMDRPQVWLPLMSTFSTQSLYVRPPVRRHAHARTPTRTPTGARTQVLHRFKTCKENFLLLNMLSSRQFMQSVRPLCVQWMHVVDACTASCMGLCVCMRLRVPIRMQLYMHMLAHRPFPPCLF